ncbi:MAG: YfhO family protein [Deltaproteobacteria bacterium]|nr:YfhO family protein [Deltaproteobacteria bacterium]
MIPASASRPRTSDCVSARRAVIGFLLILVALYFPLFLGNILFTRDIAHWIFPARAFVRATLLAGELPVWNPYQGLGFPVLGDPLYGVFYPPNWLLLLVGSSWVANALGALDFSHMAWGGLGVFFLARRLRAAPLAAGIAALAWSLSGYITAQWTAGLRLHAGAWIPWVGVGHLALLSALRGGGRRWRMGVVKAALPTGLALLMGELFLAVMGLGLALGLVVVVHLAERRQDASLPRFRPRWLAVQGAAVAMALGLGAVAFVPAHAVMAGSPRATALSRADAEASSLHPLRVLEFVAPGCMGDVHGDYPAARIVGEPGMDGLPLSYSVYLGASVLGLALIALRRRFLVVGLAGLTGCALLVAFGEHLPAHALLRLLVPPLGYMRFPEKYMTLVVVGVALLAGLGAQRLLSAERQAWPRTTVFLGGVVAAGLLALFLLPFPWSGFMVHGLRHGAIALLALLGVHGLAARGSRLAAPMLATVVVLDLAVSTWGLQAFSPRAIAAREPTTVTRLARDHAGHLEPPRIYRSPATDSVMNQRMRVTNPADGEQRLLATLVPNTVNAWGIASLPGYDAAIPARFERLWHAGWRAPATRLATLRLLGVDYAVLPDRASRPTSAPPPGLQAFGSPAPGARLYRVTESLPAVFLAGQGTPVADDAGLPLLFAPAVVAGAATLLASDAPALPGPPGRAGTCTLTEYSARHVEARCRAERESLAVFNEQYDPGWRATIDGRAAPVLRANLVMRAVRLAPGEHHVVLDYAAPRLALGIALTLVCLAALLGLAVAARWSETSA